MVIVLGQYIWHNMAWPNLHKHIMDLNSGPWACIVLPAALHHQSVNTFWISKAYSNLEAYFVLLNTHPSTVNWMRGLTSEIKNWKSSWLVSVKKSHSARGGGICLNFQHLGGRGRKVRSSKPSFSTYLPSSMPDWVMWASDLKKKRQGTHPNMVRKTCWFWGERYLSSQLSHQRAHNWL